MRKMVFIACTLTFCSQLSSNEKVAQKPPLGWNSFDAFYATVTEQEVKDNAFYLKTLLASYGWEYIVVDYCWSYPTPGLQDNPPQTPEFVPALAMDEHGRVLPSPGRFPSASGGKGFKPLADYVHNMGLKFGIHIMRGIPRQAVTWKSKVKGTSMTAADIADTDSTCRWLNHMYGVDMTKKGAQEYYDSLFELYAAWSVDYVKVDDISSPYHGPEIEAIHKAINRCGRPMVLSLSPGPTPIDRAEHVKKYANLWRISGDFWDRWDALLKMFDLCAEWQTHIGSGNWPDADMLPIGRLGIRTRPGLGPHRWSNFTRDQQYTLLSMWCIFRSPLMIGGDLQQIDTFTLSLLNNPEVLSVNQNSTNNRQVFRDDKYAIWAADIPRSKDKYVAVFNLDKYLSRIKVELTSIGMETDAEVRDLWLRTDIGTFHSQFAPVLHPHGGGLYRVLPVE